MHAVIFDIDGTLLQSAAVDDALYRRAVRDVLGDVVLRDSLHDYEHVTDTGILHAILDDNGVPRETRHLDDVRSRFVELLDRHISRHGPFEEIPGARDLLDTLSASSSHAVAMATGGWRPSAELKLRSAGMDFASLPLVTADEHHERTAIMELALARLGHDCLSVTYYGDGPWDRTACAELGWHFVAVGSALAGLENYIGHAPRPRRRASRDAGR